MRQNLTNIHEVDINSVEHFYVIGSTTKDGLIDGRSNVKLDIKTVSAGGGGGDDGGDGDDFPNVPDIVKPPLDFLYAYGLPPEYIMTSFPSTDRAGEYYHQEYIHEGDEYQLTVFYADEANWPYCKVEDLQERLNDLTHPSIEPYDGMGAITVLYSESTYENTNLNAIPLTTTYRVLEGGESGEEDEDSLEYIEQPNDWMPVKINGEYYRAKISYMD